MPDSLTAPLNEYAPRTLRALARSYCGFDVRVEVSARLTEPLTVLFASNAVMLNPQLAGLYDLFLGCAMLRKGDIIRRDLMDDLPVSKMLRRLVMLKARHDVRFRLPGAQRKLVGHFHPEGSGAWAPECAWDQASWETFSTGSGGFVDNSQVTWTTAVDMTTCYNDWEAFRQLLVEDRIPLRQIPVLRELPVAELPIKLGTIPPLPEDWTVDRKLAPWHRELRREYMECHVRRATNEVFRIPELLRSAYGGELDTSRLVEAKLAAVTHSSARVFRRRAVQTEPTFRAHDHLVVHGLDLNSVFPGGFFFGGRLSDEVAYMAYDAFRRLGVDLGLIMFADQIISLPDGRHVYVHIPIVIKDPMEPFTQDVWARAHALLDAPIFRFLDAIPVCFPPFALDTMYKMLRRTEKDRHHFNRLMHFIGSTPMPEHRELKFFRQSHFLSRVTDHMDEQILKMNNELQGFRGASERLGGSLWIPSEISAHARPGGIVARMTSK